jgi:hypothetical protein
MSRVYADPSSAERLWQFKLHHYRDGGRAVFLKSQRIIDGGYVKGWHFQTIKREGITLQPHKTLFHPVKFTLK